MHAPETVSGVRVVLIAVKCGPARRPKQYLSMGKRKRGAANAAEDVLRRQEAEHPNVVAGRVIIPQKRWYRQRAHANPFSDHSLV